MMFRLLGRLLSENLLLLISMLFVGYLLYGCATVAMVPADRLHDQAFIPDTTPIGHMYVDNWGIYLFKHIPIVTGNMDSSGIFQFPRLFVNTVHIDVLVEKVAREAKRQNGNILSDLRTRDRSYWLPYFPIFWLNELEVSANLSLVVSPHNSDSIR